MEELLLLQRYDTDLYYFCLQALHSICIPMVFRQYLLDAVNAITGNLNKTDAVSVIQKLCKSLSLAVLCEAALVLISSHGETVKKL